MQKELLTDRDDLFVIHGFLSLNECEQYISLSETAGFGDAPINSLGGPVLRKHIRNNDRAIIDDVDLAGSLWSRLAPVFPERPGSWRPIGLNERFRFYRYDPGQHFDWHCDGCYERSPREQSAFTFMIYLNGGCAGGATEFNLRMEGGIRPDDRILRVQPEPGKALLFPHHMLHRGAPVAAGRKYVLRTDVMYRWRGKA